MFQFRRFPAYAYLFQRTLTEYCSAGFPHSEISGSSRMCRSPKLIAACHVLLRLLMPRHSPCALICLTYSSSVAVLELCRLLKSVLSKLYFPLPGFNFCFRFFALALPLCICFTRFVSTIFILPLCCLAIFLLFVQFSRCC